MECSLCEYKRNLFHCPRCILHKVSRKQDELVASFQRRKKVESIVSQAVKPFVELHDTMSGHAKRLTKLRLVMMRDQISLLKKQNELIAKEKIEKEKFVELRKTCMKRAQKNLSEKKLLLTDMKKLITGLLQSYEQVGKEVEAKQRSLLAEYFSFLPVCRLNESYCSVFHICIPNNLSLQKLFDGISGSNAKAAQNTATWLPAALYNILPSFALKSDLLNSEVREIFAPSLPFLIVSESKPDPEVNYTCWGYISYILKSISAYLNIHLPYEMNFLSSRSIIMDRSKKSFPLYYCPNTAFLTQESTLHALSLLNSNISVIFDFVKKTSLHNSSESDWNVVIGQHSFILRLVFLLQMIKIPKPVFTISSEKNYEFEDEWNVIEAPSAPTPIEEDDLKMWEQYIPHRNSNVKK